VRHISLPNSHHNHSSDKMFSASKILSSIKTSSNIEHKMARVWWGLSVFVFGKMRIECVCVFGKIRIKRGCHVSLRVHWFSQQPSMATTTSPIFGFICQRVFHVSHDDYGFSSMNNPICPGKDKSYIYSHVTHSPFINDQLEKRLLVLFSKK